MLLSSATWPLKGHYNRTQLHWLLSEWAYGFWSRENVRRRTPYTNNPFLTNLKGLGISSMENWLTFESVFRVFSFAKTDDALFLAPLAWNVGLKVAIFTKSHHLAKDKTSKSLSRNETIRNTSSVNYSCSLLSVQFKRYNQIEGRGNVSFSQVKNCDKQASIAFV